MSQNRRCFLVEKNNDQIQRGIRELDESALPDGDVMIEVRYSALNYKDALAASGHPGVALNLPLIPGIDAVGLVVESRSERILVGDHVIVSGADFGTAAFGGWADLASVPDEYCIKLPEGMSFRDAAILGTAGFTAAQSVEKLQFNDVRIDCGPVLVTGATGGVGILAVKMLHRFGYHVVAATGKLDRADWLKEHGAAEVIDRNDLLDDGKRPLLSARWAGAIDTVGGTPLVNILKSTKRAGCVTACGLVAGHDFNMTVYPFILRGVTLQGIDSANASLNYRQGLWWRMANNLKVENLESIATEVELDNIHSSVETILKGGVAGRHLVRVSQE